MAISESELTVVVRAITTELQAGMQQAASAVQSAAAQMQSATAGMAAQSATSHAAVQGHVAKSAAAHQTFYERVSASLSGVSGSLRAYGEVAAAAFAVLAGERFLANVIKSTQEWAFEVEHLAKLLGVSTEEASVYAVAAKEAGIGVEAFDRAARGLVRTLSTKPEAFANIKVDIDNLKTFPALLEGVLNRIDRYKEGINRLSAAQSVFGGRVQPETLEGLRRWVEALPHATEVAQAFGVVLSEQGVASARAYQRATADLELVTLGFKEVIADALRPELESLIAKITALAKDGSLKRWAEESVAGVKTVSSDVVALGGLLIEHKSLIEAAAGAWLSYRAALIGVEVVSALGVALGGLNGVLFAFEAFAGGAATASEALAFALGALGVAETVATGGLNLVVPLLAAAAGGLITYEGWWGRVTTALRTTILALSGPDGLQAAWESVAHAADDAATAGEKAATYRPLSAHSETPEAALAGLKKSSEGTETFGGTAAQQAKAEKAAYELLKSTRDADLADAGSDLARKLAIEQTYALNVAALRGVTKEQELEARKAVSEATRRLSAEDAAITIGHLREELSERMKALDEEKRGLEDQLRQGTISAPAFLAAAQELADRRLAIVRAMYAAEKDAAEGNRRELAAIDDKIAAAEAASARERLENQRKADAAVLAEQKDNAKYLGELFGGLGQGLNTGLESLLDRNKSAADVMRSIWQGLAKDILKILEQIVAKEIETLAVEKLITAGYLEGAVSKKTGTLGEQFSGGILNLLTGTKPGGGAPAPAPGGGGVGAGVGAATGLLGGGDPRVAAEQQTQAQLTNLTQHGLLARLALTAAHYAKVGALGILHFVQERAREAVALAKWIATQGIKLAIVIATETGITAVTIAESAVRHAKDIAQVIKSIIAYAYKAAAGAASAVADIPYVGPILAVVNYGIVLGTVLGGASAVSAEGGADLPSGGPFNLIAHKKEMVLPEEHAETIRGLATVVRELVSGRSGGAEGSRITIGGPELSLASVRTSPALERGVAAVHAALTGAGETGTSGGAGDLHIHYSALDLPSGKEALRKHAETIHQIVARHSAKQGGGRRHP